MKLYEINASIDAVLQLAIDGEISDDDLIVNLEAIELAFDEKADSIACAIKNELALIAAIKAEEESLAARRKKSEGTAERMKAYLSDQMLAAGKPKLTTARNAITHRSSEPVAIDDESLIPELYMRTKTEIKPDKTAIKTAIKAGEIVPGAHLESKKNIQIK